MTQGQKISGRSVRSQRYVAETPLRLIFTGTPSLIADTYLCRTGTTYLCTVIPYEYSYRTYGVLNPQFFSVTCPPYDFELIMQTVLPYKGVPTYITSVGKLVQNHGTFPLSNMTTMTLAIGARISLHEARDQSLDNNLLLARAVRPLVKHS